MPKIQRALILATIIKSEVKDVVLFIIAIILKSNTAHTHKKNYVKIMFPESLLELFIYLFIK